jgi:hypothetical protein
MSVTCECRVLFGRAPCDGPITRPLESCRLYCVAACDLGTSTMIRSWPHWAVLHQRKNDCVVFSETYFKLLPVVFMMTVVQVLVSTAVFIVSLPKQFQQCRRNMLIYMTCRTNEVEVYMFLWVPLRNVDEWRCGSMHS